MKGQAAAILFIFGYFKVCLKSRDRCKGVSCLVINLATNGSFSVKTTSTHSKNSVNGGCVRMLSNENRRLNRVQLLIKRLDIGIISVDGGNTRMSETMITTECDKYI